MIILFWNINKQKYNVLISQLIIKNNPDVFILAECSEETAMLISDTVNYNYLQPIISKNQSIHVLYKSDIHISIIQEYKKRMLVLRVNILNEDMILSAIHFPSKVFLDEKNQLSEAIDYYQEIEKIEGKENIKNTVIIGDFNMNPFDQGMIAGNSFNTTISEDIALQMTRTINRKKYEYFYNPSWVLFGKYSKNYGTYFLKNPDHSSFHWNIYDQVLIRATFLKNYKISYITIDNGELFDCNGNGFSDHIPIIAEIIRR